MGILDVVVLSVEFFTTEAGRQPAKEFLDDLLPADVAFIIADIRAYAKDQRNAPVSWKAIRGHRPMAELRTGRFRTLFAVADGTMWILGVCKKQDQEREIVAASTRMKQLVK